MQSAGFRIVRVVSRRSLPLTLDVTDASFVPHNQSTTRKETRIVKSAVRLPTHLLIGDQRIEDSSAGTYDHVRPSTGKVQASFALAGAREVDLAVQAAREALPGWKSIAPNVRRNLILRLADMIEKNAEDFVAIAAMETGIPVKFGGGVPSAVEWFRYYAGWADKVEGKQIPTFPMNGFDYTISEPYGVIGAIISWNFPLSSIAMKVPAALAAGNCVVVKPSERAPFAAARLGELVQEAGFPPGVVSVIAAGPEGGECLVRHPGVDKLSFTGSGETAKTILRAAADRLTPIALELGGKSANLIFADCDIEKAVTLASTFPFSRLAGQGCVLPTRVLVEDSVYDEVVERIAARSSELRVGDPFNEETDVGPVISGADCDRIQAVIERAKQAGAKVATGGERLGGDLADGFFIAPTVFAEVDPTSELANREVFGPVVATMRFSSDEEAVSLANRTEYGLGAYISTTDVGRVHRLARLLDAGVVNVNGMAPSQPSVPFGGQKQSGYGREGGEAGLHEFIRPKNVFIGLS